MISLPLQSGTHKKTETDSLSWPSHTFDSVVHQKTKNGHLSGRIGHLLQAVLKLGWEALKQQMERLRPRGFKTLRVAPEMCNQKATGVRRKFATV